MHQTSDMSAGRWRYHCKAWQGRACHEGILCMQGYSAASFRSIQAQVYMVTAAWTAVSHRGRVQLKLIFVEEGDGQPGKTKYSLYKIHCRKQDMVKRRLLVCKHPEHIQVKVFSPIEMDKSSGLGCRPKTVKEDFEPLALACGLVSNVGRRSLRSASATSL